MTANASLAVPSAGLGALIRDYIALTKPRIITLLLITTVPAMIVAERGWPSGWLILATLIGGTLSAGGANALNCWYDRDIDGIMQRTRGRPLVRGSIRPANAFIFGVALGAGAFFFLWATTTLMAAALALSALLFYVLIYTMWLKRRTSQNIVIGGAAGAFPPMVGWAAVTGDITLASFIMFAIIFFWTPPHFWALALRLKDDYAGAGVPMLPVTDGPAATRLQILRYTVMLGVITVLLGPAAELGAVYLAATVVLGALFTYHAWTLWSAPQRVSPMSVYKYSLLYLALLFVAMAADVLILA